MESTVLSSQRVVLQGNICLQTWGHWITYHNITTYRCNYFMSKSCMTSTCLIWYLRLLLRCYRFRQTITFDSCYSYHYIGYSILEVYTNKCRTSLPHSSDRCWESHLEVYLNLYIKFFKFYHLETQIILTRNHMRLLLSNQVGQSIENCFKTYQTTLVRHLCQTK